MDCCCCSFFTSFEDEEACNALTNRFVLIRDLFSIENHMITPRAEL